MKTLDFRKDNSQGYVYTSWAFPTIPDVVTSRVGLFADIAYYMIMFRTYKAKCESLPNIRTWPEESEIPIRREKSKNSMKSLDFKRNLGPARMHTAWTFPDVPDVMTSRVDEFADMARNMITSRAYDTGYAFPLVIKIWPEETGIFVKRK